MNPSIKKAVRRMLGAKMAKIEDAAALTPPKDGWLKAIRTSLSMPSTFAARKAGVTAHTFREFEQREAAGTITLNSLKRAADAIGCDFVYALIPRAGSLDAVINQQAQRRAEMLVRPVSHSMMMEGQATGSAREKIQELAAEFASTPNHALWDDE